MSASPVRHAAPSHAPAKVPSHARRPGGSPVARIIGMVATAAVAFAGAGMAATAMTLTGNITSVDAEEALGEERPERVVPDDPAAGQPLNILLVGSDTRDGQSVNDGTQGARADTTMIMAIAADRSRVEFLSIPRDTTLDVPSCPTTSGGSTPPLRHVKFNAAFAQGSDHGGDAESGALCAMRTIETISDVRLDGFIVVDFSGFEQMIDALDGVEMCIPNDIDAPKADNLVLTAGVHDLDGETALKYARARTGKGLGDGSDIGRIARQQELMAAMARTVLDQNLLTDAPQLLQFLDATTSSLSMSSNLASIQGLAGLAYSSRGLRPDTIAFMTVPWVPDPSNPANVVLTPEADVVWENLRYGRPLSDVIEVEEDEAVEVSNGDGTQDAADDPGDGGSTDADEPADAAPEQEATEQAEEPEPEPTQTRNPRESAFTGADVTSVCG